MDREITVVTLNLAGAMRTVRHSPNRIKRLAKEVKKYNPDLIGLQEVIVVSDGKRNDLETFGNELGKNHIPLFASALNSFAHAHPRKWTSSIFNEYHSDGKKIHQGLGMIINKGDNEEKITVVDPWSKDDKRTEHPVNIGRIMPIPGSIYCGDRDTEPRCLMMSKVRIGGRNVLFCCTQLSTLKEENYEIKTEDGIIKIRKPTKKSVDLRLEQAIWIVKDIKNFQKITGEKLPIILAGDYNAEAESQELSVFRELGLVHAHLGSENNWINSSGWTNSPIIPHTHKERYSADEPGRRILIDHVYISEDFFSVKEAYIIDVDDLKEDESSKILGDHNLVIIKLKLLK